MKNVFFLYIFLVLAAAVSAQGSKQLLQQMHERYAGKWHQTLTFNQTTEIYLNDTLVRTERWYENIHYPKDFRIDFGHPDSGRAVIYHNDSSFVFSRGKITSARADENDLIFLLGGMYFYPIDIVFTKMKSYGYDLDKFHEDELKGEPVYVIGAGKGEETVNQLWIDKGNFNLLRMITFTNGRKQEAMFENHVKIGGGFSETLVRFFVNDKLVQIEKYYDLQAGKEISHALFDPYHFIKSR
ncbi:MAG: hypothetical protein ABIP35_17825 [Ginsengibacter sp.]